MDELSPLCSIMTFNEIAGKHICKKKIKFHPQTMLLLPQKEILGTSRAHMA